MPIDTHILNIQMTVGMNKDDAKAVIAALQAAEQTQKWLEADAPAGAAVRTLRDLRATLAALPQSPPPEPNIPDPPRCKCGKPKHDHLHAFLVTDDKRTHCFHCGEHVGPTPATAAGAGQ